MQFGSSLVEVIIFVFFACKSICVKSEYRVFETEKVPFASFENEDNLNVMVNFERPFESASSEFDKSQQQLLKVDHPTNHWVNLLSGPLPTHQEEPKGIGYSVQTINYRKPRQVENLSQDPSYISADMMPYPFYPFQIVAAIRHKEIYRSRPASSSTSNIKERLHTRKVKTFDSKMVHDISQFDHESDHTLLNVLRNKAGGQSRRKRNANSGKSHKQIRGSLLPVALTIMGENGELLTERDLIHHIEALVNNASNFKSDNGNDEMNNYDGHDAFLNEKDFHWIMKNSINLTDSAMLSAYEHVDVNESSLLMNPYVNEYLNCIDASKVTNKFQSLQSKIDCMKRKIFDNDNIFKLADSSRYSISNLPGTLVYADVMRNIKKLLRPKNGVGFYSIPMDKLSHLKYILLPIEQYESNIRNLQSAQINYKNQQMQLNGNTQPSISVLFVVKPDGRVYKIEEVPNHYQTVIFHGFPDIPHADVCIEEISPVSFIGPMFYSD